MLIHLKNFAACLPEKQRVAVDTFHLLGAHQTVPHETEDTPDCLRSLPRRRHGRFEPRERDLEDVELRLRAQPIVRQKLAEQVARDAAEVVVTSDRDEVVEDECLRLALAVGKSVHLGHLQEMKTILNGHLVSQIPNTHTYTSLTVVTSDQDDGDDGGIAGPDDSDAIPFGYAIPTWLL